MDLKTCLYVGFALYTIFVIYVGFISYYPPSIIEWMHFLYV